MLFLECIKRRKQMEAKDGLAAKFALGLILLLQQKQWRISAAIRILGAIATESQARSGLQDTQTLCSMLSLGYAYHKIENWSTTSQVLEIALFQ